MCIRDRAGGGMQDMVANMVAEQMEAAVDAQLAAVESDMHDLEGARKKRLAQLKDFEKKKREWKAKGHGVYDEVHEQDFFAVCKQSNVLCVHFYRDSTARCGILDRHLERLAPKHLECRFIKVNAEKSVFLSERMDIIVLPTLCLIKENKCIHKVIGFGEMGDTDNFSTNDLAKVLSTHDMVVYQENDEYPDANQQPANGIKAGYIGYQKQMVDDYDSDDWENWE
eukprot:TRINITY_DN571_c0_g1_i1.p1 TRINITY_DN571_c0_g1~~TRINITY_DN571_c0_g1_i1.p1  ORF type:complete len:225 (+),score=65.69 TRINITY_DN571_c0_g1_i1:130-804(+)